MNQDSNSNRGVAGVAGSPFSFVALIAGLAGPAASPVSAQVVVPPHFAKAEGLQSDSGALTNSSAGVRVLQIHDSLPSSMTIRQLALRRDGYWTGAFSSASLIYDVFLSHAAKTPQNISPNFAANHGSDRKRVAAFARTDIPKSSAGPMPSAFAVRFPFNNGDFKYRRGPLCIEIVVHSVNPRIGLPLDIAAQAHANGPLQWKVWGTGCRYKANHSPATLGPGGGPAWQATPPSVVLGWGGSSLVPNTIAVLSLGLSANRVGGVPLPFELPRTRGATSGPCSLYCDSVVTIPLFVRANETFVFQQRFPVYPTYHGFSLYGQAIQRAAGANPLGVVTSNVTQHQITAPFGVQPVSSVWVSPPGPVGGVSKNSGYVVELR